MSVHEKTLVPFKANQGSFRPIPVGTRSDGYVVVQSNFDSGSPFPASYNRNARATVNVPLTDLLTGRAEPHRRECGGNQVGAITLDFRDPSWIRPLVFWRGINDRCTGSDIIDRATMDGFRRSLPPRAGD